jgi:hypothetical protein
VPRAAAGGPLPAPTPTTATDDPAVERGGLEPAETDGGAVPTPPPPAVTPPSATPPPATPPPATPPPATPPLARLGDLDLWLPAAEPLVVGYHEAAHVSAEAVAPVGRLVEDHNTTRTDLPDDATAGPGYVVLSSRGRAAGPTSAIDVVLPEGTEVLAPVTGSVVDVRSYVLYGAHQDLRIEIVPDARPDLRLVIIHLDGVHVAVGDRVVGGVSPIAATPRSFPFSSHIDRETEPERHPHVHLELQPRDRPRPGDGDAGDDAGEDGAEDDGRLDEGTAGTGDVEDT